MRTETTAELTTDRQKRDEVLLHRAGRHPSRLAQCQRPVCKSPSEFWSHDPSGRLDGSHRGFTRGIRSHKWLGGDDGKPRYLSASEKPTTLETLQGGRSASHNGVSIRPIHN